MSFYLILPLVQTVFSFVLMSIVLSKHSWSFIHRLFALYLFFVAFWGIVIFGMRASPDIYYAFNWEKGLLPLGMFIAVVLYHFSVRFTDAKTKSWLFTVLYGLSFLFIPPSILGLIVTGMRRVSYGYTTIFSPLAAIWILFIYALLIMTILNFIRAWKNSPYAEQRNQAGYITLGIFAGFIGGIFDILPALGLPLYPGAIIGTIIGCTLITIAIVRYNLLDIHIVLRKSSAYILTSFLFAIPFVILWLLVNNTVIQLTVPWWIQLVLVIALALALPHLWQIVQQRVDKWFYRDRYDYLKALEIFSRNTQSLRDSDKLGETIVKLVAGALRVSSIYFLQPLPPNDDFTTISSATVDDTKSNISLRKHSPLIRWLDRYGDMLFCSDFDTIPQLYGAIDKEKEILKQVKAELIVPLKSRSFQLVGLLILGPKLSEQAYNFEDNQLIYTIGNQMATNLENVRLYNDVTQVREDLERWFNSISDCVFIINTDYTLRFINKAGVEKFGSKIGDTCWHMLGKDTQCTDCPMQQFIHNDNKEYHHISSIGDKQYDIIAAPLLSAGGSQSVVEVLRDITEIKKMQDNITRATAQIEALQNLERFKTELLSMVSHELRTPLTVIKGYATMLLRSMKLTEKEQLEILQDINQETDRLTHLVSNLLNMSRIEAGNLGIQKDSYQISEILKRIEKPLLTITKHHQLKTMIPEDLPSVYVDIVRIGEVFINLCENAAKYSKRNSQITIKAASFNSQVVVSIIDRGEGIPPEVLGKIFNKFYRSDYTISKKPGIGLGLAICRGIVEAHNGKIWAKSEIKVGSRFSFSLPISQNEEKIPSHTIITMRESGINE